MDIKKIQEKEAKLYSELALLIKNFQSETSLKVRSIEIKIFHGIYVDGVDYKCKSVIDNPFGNAITKQ